MKAMFPGIVHQAGPITPWLLRMCLSTELFKASVETEMAQFLFVFTAHTAAKCSARSDMMFLTKSQKS